MKITALESWYGGSHKQWLDGLSKHSSHDFELLTMTDSHWKWRMQGGSLELAAQYKSQKRSPDLILSSSMVDLSLFDSLAKTQDIPKVIYFHENQFAYPVSEMDTDKLNARDQHYAFINLKSALIANSLLFNSQYNMNSFLDGVKEIRNILPDYTDSIDLKALEKKSSVVPLGFDLIFKKPKVLDVPVILWNHRFEYDKNPDDFFNLMIDLKEENFNFKLIVLGEGSEKSSLWKERLKDSTLHWGKVDTREEYFKWLDLATIIPITSNQDFFGISIVEAISRGLHPFLPNRLAYPELIPESERKNVFYTDISDLRSRIKMGISEMTVLECQKHLTQYEWKNLIGRYDSILSGK
ncbi:MAG: DUF3524 domain-containing protein [Deltaproteobacteria bacterium]|nr:MAG: DUF3524 domain-containing protein [Deltaproteobacteria bacterium]